MFIYQLEGNLKLLKGKLKLAIGQLTNNHFYVINAKRDLAIANIQLTYGLSSSEAKIVSTWNLSSH